MYNQILIFNICIAALICGQVDMNYSYELKYGDGKEVINTNLFDATNSSIVKNDYGYLENLLEVNTTFNNGLYIFTQLEYSAPPILGEDYKGINKFYMEHYWNKFYFKVGDIYSLFGRGLALNLTQDQVIDYDNSVSGVEVNYNLADAFRIITILGESKFENRSNPADRMKNSTIETKLSFIGFEYDHTIFGLTGLAFLNNDFNNLSGISSEWDTPYVLREYDYFWGKQFNNFDIYIENVLSINDNPEYENGSRFYASVYTNIFDYGITYEYKNYIDSFLDDKGLNLISSSPPTVLRESNSILISNNAHSINWQDEIGHQIEINKSFSEKLIIQSNLSIAYNHLDSKSNILDIVKMDNKQRIYKKYPFRQFYLEANGWALNDALYYKLGFDQFDDLKLDGILNKEISATTIPSILSYNINNTNSFTIYAEYQERDELTYLRSEQSTTMIKEINYFDKYFSLTYNFMNKVSITLFNMSEVYNGWSIDEIIKNKKTIWEGIDLTYKLSSSMQCSIFKGSQKGGLVCANGICAVQPGFDDGYKITVRSIF